MLPVALNLRACINILRHIILWLTDLQVQLAADTSVWRPPPFFSSRQLSLKSVACRQVTFIVAKWRAADWRPIDRVSTPSNVDSLLNVYSMPSDLNGRYSWRVLTCRETRPSAYATVALDICRLYRPSMKFSERATQRKRWVQLRHYSHCAVTECVKGL